MSRTKGSKWPNRGVLPVKGSSVFNAPIIKGPSIPKKGKGVVTPWIIGSSQAKIVIMDMLKIDEPGAGYCHFPSHYEDKYFQGLTAEKLMTKYTKGFPRKEWHKIRSYNEPLDCRVYSYAALKILNPNWDLIIAQNSKEKPIPKPKESNELGDNPRKPMVIPRKRKIMRLNLA
jgi:phage terminase large subunit GpA-like protein